jgi:hypothetical protein
MSEFCWLFLPVNQAWVFTWNGSILVGPIPKWEAVERAREIGVTTGLR